MEVNLPPPNNVKVTRDTFGTFYGILYHQIESHMDLSSVKPRSWKTWEDWNSNGMRKRMTSYVKLSKIIYGKVINLTTLIDHLFATLF